ncbi:hypothetical protein [Streptomyces sp. 891-h]|uniref:hypothetical protein n=1 Tax=Streptomyces sp. 891-h TaxID=2720714 RepID=UPI001FAAF36D|nr:hypothetical protein [Streptomyces sp. 891-h]UNZ21169.1 hypothetical protein HC362_32930 [Streptomyces sp. 891-h]
MEPLGHSLLLEDGDLVVRDGALAQVRGTANLLQSLSLRLLTPYGSDRFNHRYGLSAGETFTRPGSVREAQELLRLEVVRTLAADPRVREVVGVVFAPGRDTGGRADRRAWTVAVTVETVDGRTAALSADLKV